jgi:PAS domain S-box-containing protein
MLSAVARRLSVLGFALSCAILALIGGSSYHRLAELRDATRAVEHTHEVRTELERILSLLTDAETGQRGFLLTGAVSYLEPYKTALASLPARLDRLRRLTADNLRQQTDLGALEVLIRRKASELNATITARETGGFDVAARIVLTDEGKRVMDQIRTAIAAMGAEEQRLLTERTQREERAGRTAVFTTVGGLALALLLGIAATVLLNQAMRDRVRAEAARVAAGAVARAIAASEERLRVTLASIGDAVIATDAEGRVTLMNPVAQALTGWSAADAAGRPLEDSFVILNEVTRRPVENPVHKVLREGTVVGLANHTVLIAKDGREVPIGDSAAPIRTAEGQLVGVVLVFRDITESRQHEQALFRLAAIVESSDDAILTKTFDGIITSWNPGAQRMFGYSAAEAVGQPITMLFPHERVPEEAEFLQRLNAGERLQHYETERVRKDGQRLQVSVSLSPLVDEAGSIAGVSKIVRDITELKRREMLLRTAHAEAEAADRAKDEFLAVLSHELRTPLTTIIGWVPMLRHAQLDAAQRERALEAVDRNARGLARMIDDLLDISRIVADKMTLERRPISLVSVIAETVESFQPQGKAKGVAIVTHVEPGAGVVSADPQRMQQVLMNLLANALRYTPAGGRVEVHLTMHDDHADIRVQDTGIGIERELLPHVFERFRQGDTRSAGTKGGLGLGLAIVRKIVELHDGTVRAESAGPGQGASFIITLPAIGDARDTD